jgi:hypothetical protein
MNITPSNSFAPIVLNRLDTLNITIGSLQKNYGASSSELFIFSDGPRSDQYRSDVDEVRDYLKTVNGFKRVTIYESAANKGLANSIIEGVTQIIGKYGKVIVLEDDLKTSPNFLSYMNQALSFYETNPKIHSVSGFTMPISGLDHQDIYFTKRASSWGWASWYDRWDVIDWTVSDYACFSANKAALNRFNKMGSDMARMLRRQMTGKINSWAIRWCYHQYRKDLYTVYPAVSKVVNIGLENPRASNTNEYFNRFKTFLDDTGNEVYHFSPNVQLDEQIIRQYTRPYSLWVRIKYKIINSFF